MLVLQLELSLFGFSVLFGYVVSFPFGTSRLLFFFLELEHSAVLSAFQLADVVRYLLQVEYFV